MTTQTLHIRLFGLLELTCGNRLLPLPSSTRTRSLLAYLIYHHDRPIPRDRLAGLFWPERPDARARRALSNALWQIRRALGPAADRLVTERIAVIFALRSGDRLDVEEFEAGIKGCAEKDATGDALSACLLELGQAVTIYRADLLEEIYDDWVLLERERLRESYLRALERLLALHKQIGDYDQALVDAQRLVAADPLYETAHRELMRLYHLLGRPQAAIKQFALLCDLLRDELGSMPGQSSIALYREIAAALDEDARSHLPIAAPPPPLLRDLAHLPFIGRTSERATLLDELRAVKQDHGGWALIEGDAGVGKTRLAMEIIADARWRGFHVGMGAAERVTTPAPYSLLTQSIAGLLTPLRVSQLSALIEPHCLSSIAMLFPTVSELIPDLPPVPELPLERQQERLWEGLARCIAALTTAAPLLLVLEDIHWADDRSLIAIRNLLPRLRHTRLLLLLTCRIAETQTRPIVRDTLEELDRILPACRIRLDPLNIGQTVTLVQRALGTADQGTEFAARLWGETNGNPLFLVETLKSLLERGQLAPSPDGGWLLPSLDAPLPVPASIQALVNERVAHLPPALRAVLELVAVLGQDTDFPVLSRTGDADPAALLPALEELEQRGFLIETESRYCFEHDRIREIIYQNIPPHRQERLHRRAGDALEALHPERIASLALHFDRGGMHEKALTYILQVAEQAQAVYDYETALTHYERALELSGDDTPIRWQVLVAQEKTFYQLGRWDDDTKALDELARLAESFPDPLYRAQALLLAGRHESIVGDPRRALALLEESLDLTRAAGEQHLLGQALIESAHAHWRMGNVGECRAAVEEAQAIFHRIGDRRWERTASNILVSLHLGLTGDYGQALSYGRESRRLANELGDSYAVAVDEGNIALAQALLGDYSAAREAIEASLAFVTRVGDRYSESAFHVFEAIIWRGLGDLERAYASARRALELCRRASNPNFEIEALGWLGRIEMEQDNIRQALHWFEQAVQVARTHSQAQDWAEQLSHLALAHSRLGDHETALRLSDEALATMEAEMETSDRLKLVYFERAHILAAAQGQRAALPVLERAYRVLMSVADRISDPALRRSFLERVAENRAIAAAYERGYLPLPPRRQKARLPSLSAPSGRPLRDDEFVTVTWTIAAPEDDEVAGKAARRRHRLLRLLREADAQSAAPTVTALAQALGVSERTIKRDLAALRAAGHAVRTRGSRRQRS